ncbi:MAG TPA: glutathione S-transferase family protein [Bdellovibrionota bacterium]|nr:glutathione S-transferase family protein [Bdellovibrionota bacterium]
MLKLHGYDRSPFSWKTRIVLEEKKVPYEMVAPPENKNEDSKFGRLNPFRLTPVLQLEDGKTVYESTVIDEYLEEVYPKPPMLPKDPYERARVRMLEDSTDLYLYRTLSDLRSAEFNYEAPYLIRKKKADVDHKLSEESRTKMHEHLSRLEKELEGRTWFGGDIFSVADAALAAPLTGTLTLIGFLPSDKYRDLSAWCRRIKERPSYIAAAPKQPVTLKDAS